MTFTNRGSVVIILVANKTKIDTFRRYRQLQMIDDLFRFLQTICRLFPLTEPITWFLQIMYNSLFFLAHPCSTKIIITCFSKSQKVKMLGASPSINKSKNNQLHTIKPLKKSLIKAFDFSHFALIVSIEIAPNAFGEAKLNEIFFTIVYFFLAELNYQHSAI